MLIKATAECQPVIGILAGIFLGPEVPEGHRLSLRHDLNGLNVRSALTANGNGQIASFALIGILQGNVAAVGVVEIVGTVGHGNVPVVANRHLHLTGTAHRHRDGGVLNLHTVLLAVLIKATAERQPVIGILTGIFLGPEIPEGHRCCFFRSKHAHGQHGHHHGKHQDGTEKFVDRFRFHGIFLLILPGLLSKLLVHFPRIYHKTKWFPRQQKIAEKSELHIYRAASVITFYTKRVEKRHLL